MNSLWITILFVFIGVGTWSTLPETSTAYKVKNFERKSLTNWRDPAVCDRVDRDRTLLTGARPRCPPHRTARWFARNRPWFRAPWPACAASARGRQTASWRACPSPWPGRPRQAAPQTDCNGHASQAGPPIERSCSFYVQSNFIIKEW